MAKERINRINEELHREIAGIVRELKDTRIPVMTSVVGVSVTNDLSYAKVYVSVMGNDEVQKNALAGLRWRRDLFGARSADACRFGTRRKFCSSSTIRLSTVRTSTIF